MEIQAIIMIVTPGGGLLAKPSSQIGLDRLFRSNRARGSACKSFPPPLRFPHFRVQTKN